MPDTPEEPLSNPLLRGLFGAFQSSAAAGQSTAEVWRQLRVAAGSQAWRISGRGPTPPDSVLEANGTEILRARGVGIQEVNAFRAVAGQWRLAKQNLANATRDEQIKASQLFTPPWARTTQLGADARYRVRVQWEVQPLTGDPFRTWGTYELSSPLTSLGDLLDQAGALVGRKPGSDIPLGATVNGAVDYELSQI